MERNGIKLDGSRSVSAAVIVPIAGMLIGVFVGMFRASRLGPDQIAQIGCVVRWMVTGFFAGLALALLVALQLRREDVISIRRLMVLVVVAALIAWFFAHVLFGAIGYEGF
jgi:hypothetical protein